LALIPVCSGLPLALKFIRLIGPGIDSSAQRHTNALATPMPITAVLAAYNGPSVLSMKYSLLQVIRGCHVNGVRVEIRFIHLLETKFLLILQYGK